MKPGKTRNTRLAESKLKPPFIIAAPKSLLHVEYEKLLENYLGAQGTFNPIHRKRARARADLSGLSRALSPG